MMMIETAIRLVKKIAGRQAQASPRAAQAIALNYASVNTLDPSRLAGAFAAADTGFITEQASLFELVEEQDAHVFAELAKRRRAVTGLGWQLAPPPDATQSELLRAAEIADMIRSIPRIEDAQYDLTDAIGKGFVALSYAWKPGDVWLPDALDFIPQRLFQVAPESRRLQFLKDGIAEDLWDNHWIIHEHRAKSGYIEQAALFRVLAWCYAYKAYDVRDMQRFLEVYGLPLRLGKYPDGIGDKQRDELLKAVKNIGHDSAGVVPASMSIEFIQAVKTGSVSDFLDAIVYWEKKQSLAILGGTLTSQADGKTSTNALGEIHNQARREIMLHDVRQLEPTLTRQLVRPIAEINGMFPEDRMPVFKYLTEETVDQGKMVKVLSEAAAIGMEIGVDYAHQVMQIPRAEEGEKILTRGAAGEVEAAPNEEEAGTKRRATLSRTAENDLPAAYAAQMAALAAPFEAHVVGQIAAIVAESGNFDEAIERIEALKRDEENYQAWARTLAEGMTAAHLAGRGTVR
jgi:phage gp29-like protein